MKEFDSQEQRIFLVGVCRNVESTIIQELENLLISIGQPCYKILIIESDSDDKTVNLLQKLSEKRLEFLYLSLGNLKQNIPSRTARIAHCRNIYMDFLDKEARDEDIVLIADDSEIRDMSLLKRIRKPVHIVLCGTKRGINQQYIKLAIATKGSIHTTNSDVYIKKLKEGDEVMIENFLFIFEDGQLNQYEQ